MRSITLSPAGKQPVRIATHMAVANEINFASKTKSKVLTIIGAVCAFVALVCGLILADGDSNTAWFVLAVSSVTAIATLAPEFKKGGAL